MKPYYQTNLGSLYHADARDIINDIPAAVVITDPVWPNALPELKGSDNPMGLLADTISRSAESVKRVSIQLGCNSDPRFLAAVGDRWEFFRVVWMRYSCPGKYGRLLYTGDTAYLFGPPPKSRPGAHLIPGEVNHVTATEQRPNHPCARSITHLMWSIHWWTQPDELVLDPFMGSGTTALACERHGRKWVGIEIEEKFCEEAAARIEQESRQLKLFAV